jgi:cell division septum initiation protein DivIVA
MVQKSAPISVRNALIRMQVHGHQSSEHHCNQSPIAASAVVHESRESRSTTSKRFIWRRKRCSLGPASLHAAIIPPHRLLPGYLRCCLLSPSNSTRLHFAQSTRHLSHCDAVADLYPSISDVRDCQTIERQTQPPCA